MVDQLDDTCFIIYCSSIQMHKTPKYHTQNVLGPQNTTRLQKHTHPQPHTTHNIAIALTTRYIN